MEYITKIRIIYSKEDEALKEYIKRFFEFIGIMVCDYMIDYEDATLMQFKKIPYDETVTDIALNKICHFISDFNNSKFEEFHLQIKPILFTRGWKKKAESKIEYRERILDELINMIWQNDKLNLENIQKLRKLFVSSAENRDLFLILYGISIAYENENLYKKMLAEDNASGFGNIIGKKSKEEEEFINFILARPVLNPYTSFVEDKFNELSTAYNSLNNEYKKLILSKEIPPSPYCEFALLNIQRKLYDILKLYEKSIDIVNNFTEIKVSLDTTDIIPFNEFIPYIYHFITKYRTFDSAKYLLISLNVGTYAMCEGLKAIGIRSKEKKYYSKAVEKLALLQEDENKLMKNLELAHSFDPLNQNYINKIATQLAHNGIYNEAERKIIFEYGDGTNCYFDKYCDFIKMKSSLLNFELLWKIALKTNREYSMKAFAERMAIITINKINVYWILPIYADEELEDFYLKLIIPFRINYAKLTKQCLKTTILERQAIGEQIFRLASKGIAIDKDLLHSKQKKVKEPNKT